MRQVETSCALVFDQGVHARASFELLLCEKMDHSRLKQYLKDGTALRVGTVNNPANCSPPRSTTAT